MKNVLRFVVALLAALMTWAIFITMGFVVYCAWGIVWGSVWAGGYVFCTLGISSIAGAVAGWTVGEKLWTK